MVSVGFWHPLETQTAPSVQNMFSTSCDWQYLLNTLVLRSLPIRAVPIS